LSPNIIILQDYLEDISVESLQDFLPPYEIYVDALLGIGLSGNVSGHYLHTIKYLNEALGFKFAVDIPSGLNANTGKTLGVSFKADLTCTLGMAKNGLFLQHGRQIAGKTLVADIGILPETENNVGIQGELLTKKSMQTVCYPRARHSHKGMLGHLGIIAGSNNMPGAAILSTGGAVTSGTGLITVLTAPEVRHPLISRFPEAMLLPVLPDYGPLNENHLIDLERFLEEKSALVFGPGLGLEPMVSTLLASVLQTAHIPVVIDADGLTALADDMSPLYETLCPVVLTPHPGEMARLTDTELEQGMEDPVQWALSLAQQYRCYVVLKCATTILASPDGRYAVNSSGNPGMATGGSGDVLSGLLGGLMASGVPPWDAARLAIYLHGIAGDLAAEKSGLRALRALDIMEQLSHALADFE
jgi:NAD(P)H-hydrate epimerase